MEVGQVVLLRKDGSEGQALHIRKDVVFGRDHPAHIRIKSKSVTMQHAKIRVDSSGGCFFQYLCDTSSRPRINGIRMASLEHTVRLHHLDIITIAGRSFLFKTTSGVSRDLHSYSTEALALALAAHERERMVRGGGRMHVASGDTDNLSLDSRSSRRSLSSQVSMGTASTCTASLCSVNAPSCTTHSSRGERESDQPACARLYLQKKDGTEGAPYAVAREATFGSQRPANIRIKSTSLAAEHARIVVDQVNNHCSLIHLADSHPPRLNGRKVVRDCAVLLHNNDVISLVGRDFVFRTGSSATEESRPCHDVENLEARRSPSSSKRKLGHSSVSSSLPAPDKGPSVPSSSSSSRANSHTSRAFGRQLDQNSGTFRPPSAQVKPNSLLIITEPLVALSSGHGHKSTSPLHSLSSLSAGDSDAAVSPLYKRVVPFADGAAVGGIDLTLKPCIADGAGAGGSGGDGGGGDNSVVRKTYRSGEKRRGASRHVQFFEDNHDEDEDEDDDDDDDDFFDIIAEAGRLLLNSEEELAVQVSYCRMAVVENEMPAADGPGDAPCEQQQSCRDVEIAENETNDLMESGQTQVQDVTQFNQQHEDECEDFDAWQHVNDMTLPRFPEHSSTSSEDERARVTTSCNISHSSWLGDAQEQSAAPLSPCSSHDDEDSSCPGGDGGVVPATWEDEQISASLEAAVLSAESVICSTDMRCGEGKSMEESATTSTSHDLHSLASAISSASPMDTDNCTRSMSLVEDTSMTSNFRSGEDIAVTVAPSMTQQPVALPAAPAPAPAPAVSLPTPHPSSNMTHILRLLLSLAVIEPISSAHHLMNNSSQSQTERECQGERTEATEAATNSGVYVSNSVVLVPPPGLPLGGDAGALAQWRLQTFRYLCRSWRGFFTGH